jgi:hypothetical protein
MLVAFLLGTTVWFSKESSLTWRAKTTKSGRLLFQLAALTPRTDEIEYGLLLTPATVMPEETPESMRARAKRNGYRNGTKWNSLASQIRYGFLLTPTTMAVEGGKDRVAKRTEYRKSTGREYYPGNLAEQIRWGFLPMPRVADTEGGVVKNVEHRNGSFSRVNSKGVRFGVKTKDALGTLGRRLSPGFALWMMGYPEDWCDLEDGEMPQLKRPATASSRASRKK